MEQIYTWVKNIVCFYIFMNIMIHLLPQESYRKYVRFFAGMLLMILVAAPILSVFGKEEALLRNINQAGFFQELDNLKLDTEHLEQTQKKIYVQEYEQAIAMDIGQMAERKGLHPVQVKVRLSEGYQVESVDMEVSVGEETTAVPKVVPESSDLEHHWKSGNGLTESKVTPENSGSEHHWKPGNGLTESKVTPESSGSEHAKAEELKRELMEFYRLEEGQIKIAVRGE